MVGCQSVYNNIIGYCGDNQPTVSEWHGCGLLSGICVNCVTELHYVHDFVTLPLMVRWNESEVAGRRIKEVNRDMLKSGL